MNDRQDQAASSAEVKDPVCGMSVIPAEAAETAEYGGRRYYFCSAACAERFKADPEAYVSPEPAEETPATVPGGVTHLAIGPAPKEPVPSVTTGIREGARIVKVELPIERMDCAECARRVQQALATIPGVQQAFVNSDSRKAAVVYDRGRVSLPQMSEAVRQAGYQLGSAEERIGVKGMT
ncbi:MAG: YHS domain-containing protein [Chloroflexota bacterium]